MRTTNSIKNSVTSFISYFIISIITIILQRIFIDIFTIEFLGLNTLFKNIFTMLNLFEFGMSTIIIYYFYKPIFNKDESKLNDLIYFTKKIYKYIILIIFCFGLLLIPFLKIIVKGNLDINIYIVYGIFLISTLFTYFISYKKCIIIAYQKNYIVNIIHTICLIITSILQIIIILIIKNYYLYLICNIFTVILENIIINIYVNNKYKYINKKEINKIDEDTKKDIFSKMKAYFLDKFATIIINNTDPIALSIFFNLKVVGIYSNYIFILNGVDAIFNGIISSLTPSIGDLLVEKSPKKNYEVFKKIRLVNLLITIFTASMILCLSQDFISIWVGKEYLFSKYILLTLTILFYKNFMKYTFKVFKHGAGIWVEDRFVPVVVAVSNIVLTLILLKIFGVVGVFFGTILSSIPHWFYDFPKFIYVKLFDKKYIDYYKEMIRDILVSIIVIVITYISLNYISLNNIICTLLLKAIIGTLINIILFFIIFRKNNEFKYFINLIKTKVRR